jgi:transcriptional regulator with XRE-family HTH domain
LRNLTQDYIASQLGISQEAYSKIEANKTGVSIQKLEQIAGVLEVNIVDLLSFDEKTIFYNSAEKQTNTNIGVVQTSQNDKELYERIIEELKTELTFLRSIIKEKLG